MNELQPIDTPPNTSASESLIWERLDVWRDAGTVAIKGMAGTNADWLHEFAKHQELLRYANRIWPDSPESPGTMNEEELAVLAEMRLANPSEEDAIWEASYTQA
jgi:hypothetical protein